MIMNIPIADQFTPSEKQTVQQLFLSGKTHAEIGHVLGRPRRTIMKLCKHLGLSRSVSEAAALKGKSHLDDPAVIATIFGMRNTHSLEQIVAVVGGSVSAVQRLCVKYGISLDRDIYKTSQAAKMVQAWTEEKRLIQSIKSRNVSDEVRQRLSVSSKELWSKPEYRAKQIAIQTEYWNLEHNKKRLAGFRSRQSGKVSSIQHILYSILDDLGVFYFREHGDAAADPQCVIGPYNFDCVIPRNGKSLLIECHGDYWHTQEKAIRVDRAKATYFERYLSNQYELKYLWEHEFACKEKVVELLKYWLDITQIEVADFELDNVCIKRAQAKDYRELLSKYHYLPNAGKGGLAYGAYLGDDLIAVCVFSPLIRQNIQIGEFARSATCELSRLCIHPRFQKKNLASWFISRCLKLLQGIDCVVSYCDTSFNHTGAIYKAVGFIQDAEVRPDYWYTDESGWVMHKKTLYKHAVKMSMKEAEYADMFGYKRIFGTKKLRFIYNLAK